MPELQVRPDAFTTEIARNYMLATAKEMAITLARSAHSPVIQHNEDFSTGIFTADAELVVQGPGLAAHIIPVEACVREAVAAIGRDSLRPGDMVISNDPFRGGTHLPDVAVLAPVFAGDDLVCFVANRAHWEDIGGMTPGSMTGASTEIFQEGLIIPPMKIVADGAVRDDLVTMICTNTRFPDARRGDLMAQIAANRIGVRNVRELLTTHDSGALRAIFETLLTQAENAARQAIAAMPDGSYVFQDFCDNDGVTMHPLRIRAEARVAGDEITIDFAGTDPMPVGPNKSVRSTTEAAVYATLKCLIDPEIPVNHGFFKPITVAIPEGTFLNPKHPASVCGDTEPMARVQDVVFALFASIVDVNVIAAQYGSVNHIIISGAREDGAPWVLYEAPAGGIGALPEADGADAVVMLMGGDVKNLPIEVLEQVYPVRCSGYRLRPDSGGPGHRRGGLGLERTYEVLVDARASLVSDRCAFAPFGLFGGYDAAPGSWVLDPGTDAERPLAGPFLSKTTGAVIPAGTVLRIRTAGGGGFGDPLSRAEEAVRADVEKGYVSAAAAQAAYGVVVTDGVVDEVATGELRERLRAARDARRRTGVRLDLDAVDAGLAPADFDELGVRPGDWISILGRQPGSIRARATPAEAGALHEGQIALSAELWVMLGLDAGTDSSCLVMPQI